MFAGEDFAARPRCRISEARAGRSSSGRLPARTRTAFARYRKSVAQLRSARAPVASHSSRASAIVRCGLRPTL